jgi:dipeptidyl aminopeptidase/acylaminoacyl peptidase
MPQKPFPLLLITFYFLLFTFLSACAPTPAIDAPYTPAFFYLSSAPNALVPQRGTLFLLDNPDSSPRQQIPLTPPPDCSLYGLRPAPRGRWIAVEWECPSGSAVEMLDTASGKAHFSLSDPSIDSRFLAWQPDGRSVYLKIGTLSVLQTLRIDAATGRATELFLSAFVYDLTVSPDSQKILYSLSKGIGFGSETWLAGPDGQNPSQLLVDAQNIIALAQFSPDGKQIAYIKLPDNQVAAPPGELWVMDSDGTNAHLLATADAGRGFSPVWSPGGDKIAFIGRDIPADEKSINLSIYNLANSALITHHSSLITAPTWSTDGASITFSSDKMEVWFYEISTGQARKLLTGACCAGWIR